MIKIKNNHINQVFGLGLALIILLGYQYTSAQWTNPPAGTVPPANNTPAPINVGTSPQTKFGNLGVIDLNAADYVKAGLQMWSPEYCDQNGQNCFTAVDVPTTGAGVGSQVYSCPVTPVSDGCNDTCNGQLQSGSTCIDSQISAGGGNSGQSCKNHNINCPYVGHLVP